MEIVQKVSDYLKRKAEAATTLCDWPKLCRTV